MCEGILGIINARLSVMLRSALFLAFGLSWTEGEKTRRQDTRWESKWMRLRLPQTIERNKRKMKWKMPSRSSASS